MAGIISLYLPLQVDIWVKEIESLDKILCKVSSATPWKEGLEAILGMSDDLWLSNKEFVTVL